MRSLKPLITALVLAVVAATFSHPAQADGDPAAEARSDTEVTRLLQAKKTLNWNQTIRGNRYGHAEALVDASAERVRDTALNFGSYKDFHRKFASAHVVGRDGDNVDLYMKLPVRVGPFKVEQWEVMRFGAARTSGAGHVLEGRGVRGNMKEGHMLISVRPVDAKHSLLKVDLLLTPGMPAPQAMVDEELRDAALDFVNGLKDKSQGWSGPVTSL